MSKRLTPKEKMLKAIFGTTSPTREQIAEAQERLFEEQANNVTDEDVEKATGVPMEEHLRKSMLYAGWCEAVAKWRLEHEKDRKYHVGGFDPVFSFGQAVDMAMLFYRQGREDTANGNSENDRLWKLNKEKQEPVAEEEETGGGNEGGEA